MIVAGFLKHNIIVMPLTCLLWFGWQQPRQALRCGVMAIVVIAAGFALCYAAYGADFFANLLAPRVSTWKHAVGGIGRLQWLAVGLAASIYLALKRWADPNVKFCSLLIGLAVVSYFLQKCGDGVADNAQFELLLGVSLGVGLMFAQDPNAGACSRPIAGDAAFGAAGCDLSAPGGLDALEPVRVLTDPSFHRTIAVREAAMADTVARIRTTRGDVLCNQFACYRAGKPYLVDAFNCGQRMKTGNLPPDAIAQLIATGKVTVVEADPLVSWSAAPRPAPDSAPQHSGL